MVIILSMNFSSITKHDEKEGGTRDIMCLQVAIILSDGFQVMVMN